MNVLNPYILHFTPCNKHRLQHTICQSFSRGEGVRLKVKLSMVALQSGRPANITVQKMELEPVKAYSTFLVDQTILNWLSLSHTKLTFCVKSDLILTLFAFRYQHFYENKLKWLAFYFVFFLTSRVQEVLYA